ncbi:hypothetical protein [Corynebacterium sphenisci]|uniref:hypothetical protein n=1 Tax=Corynebacterium sphenisci TaxID=191493 RepID=UPI0026DEB739|nr:hypothetical protein [Corynebacterium sphenisci]MDO5730772.1 hypothetical protein [Corynebacterium sphenisci]
MLGAEEHTVMVADWRAERVVWQSAGPGLVAVEWAREAMETTKATVTAVVPRDVVEMLEPWAQTLTIFRGGRIVWHGVLVTMTATAARVTLSAADGSVFFSRRRVPLARLWQQHDATQVMRTMVEDACGPLDATGMVSAITTRESRIWVTASWTPAECMLDDVVDDLVEQGLVWSVVAGRLLIGPVAAQHTTALLSDRDIDGQMQVVKDGAAAVTDAHVVGKGVWGQWMDEDSPLGLLQVIEKADGAVREEECRQMARRLVQDGAVTPRRLVMPSSARLLPTAPVRLEELLPGARVPVASSQTGVTVAATMAVKSVKVTAGDDGEHVNVTLVETKVTDDVPNLPDPALIDMRSPCEKELARKNAHGSGGGRSDDDAEDVGVPPA